jgi:RNA polymerase sigma factor (TIGR02999 family)
LPEPGEVTRLLLDWSKGDPAALERLMPVIYDELRRLARSFLRKERRGHLLQTTALVHEAYLRLVDQRQVQWQNRAHFFAISAQLMRRILVDHARRRAAAKRGGDPDPVTLAEVPDLPLQRGIDVLALDQALSKLAALDPRQSRIVELKCFGGLSSDETAEALELSPRTVRREWTIAKAWLYRQIYGDAAGLK